MNHKIGPRSSTAGVIAAAGMFVATSLFMTQAAWAVFDSAAAPAGSDLKVLRAVPEGDEVPLPGRQLVVTFDRPVVAIGQMAVNAAASPVTVPPSVDFQS